jgi:hypothetical protein
MTGVTLCDAAYIQFLMKSSSDLGRFVSLAQSCLALMRQESCGVYMRTCEEVGRMVVDVTAHLLHIIELQMSCVADREAATQILQLSPSDEGMAGSAEVAAASYEAYIALMREGVGVHTDMVEKLTIMIRRM